MSLKFNVGEFDEVLRKLAKEDRFQSIYSAKELGFKFFENNISLTYNQLLFLSYVAMYNTLYTDIYMGEVNKRILEDFIFEDAYLYYKNQVQANQKKQQAKQAQMQAPKLGRREKEIETLSQSEFVFKRNRRRK